MSDKPIWLVTAPVATRSGYGAHSRDICRALIKLDKYDVKIWPVRWGNTPMNALNLDDENDKVIIDRLLSEPNLPKQPEFILMPPPIVPGIQYINSKPLILFSNANIDNLFWEHDDPDIILSLSNLEIEEKLLLNFIIVPSYTSSLNNTLEPDPSTNNFALFE